MWNLKLLLTNFSYSFILKSTGLCCYLNRSFTHHDSVMSLDNSDHAEPPNVNTFHYTICKKIIIPNITTSLIREVMKIVKLTVADTSFPKLSLAWKLKLYLWWQTPSAVLLKERGSLFTFEKCLLSTRDGISTVCQSFLQVKMMFQGKQGLLRSHLK